MRDFGGEAGRFNGSKRRYGVGSRALSRHGYSRCERLTWALSITSVCMPDWGEATFPGIFLGDNYGLNRSWSLPMYDPLETSLGMSRC